MSLLIDPYRFAPAGDALFSKVVLLLPGNSAVDKSSYAHVATSIGAGVTFDSSPSSSNGGVGSTSIRTNAAAAANWTYGTPAPEWRYDPEFTLEYWVYFDAAAGNWLCLSATDFSRFMQWVGGGGGANLNAAGKYGAPGGYGSTIGAWHWVVECSDGVNAGLWFDGVLQAAPSIAAADGSDKAFEVLDLLANNPDYRFMQIRYTNGPGSARYNPLAATIPVQTAPWPLF